MTVSSQRQGCYGFGRLEDLRRCSESTSATAHAVPQPPACSSLCGPNRRLFHCPLWQLTQWAGASWVAGCWGLLGWIAARVLPWTGLLSIAGCAWMYGHRSPVEVLAQPVEWRCSSSWRFRGGLLEPRGEWSGWSGWFIALVLELWRLGLLDACCCLPMLGHGLSHSCEACMLPLHACGVSLHHLHAGLYTVHGACFPCCTHGFCIGLAHVHASTSPACSC